MGKVLHVFCFCALVAAIFVAATHPEAPFGLLIILLLTVLLVQLFLWWQLPSTSSAATFANPGVPTSQSKPSDRWLRAMLENNVDVIGMVDANFKLIYRTPSATRLLGWTDEEVKAHNSAVNIHPDDAAIIQTALGACMAAPGKSVPVIFRNRHKDGHYLWMEGTIVNYLEDPEVNAIVFNCRDVTQRVNAEQQLAASELRFRSLIENSVEGISLLDDQANVLYCSPSAYRMLGNNALVKTSSFAHPDQEAMFQQKFAETRQKPGIPVPYRIKYLHANGHFFWVEGKFTNLLHLEGVNAIVANYHEITEKVEAEEKLAASERRFRVMIEHSKDVIMLLDQELNIRYQSPSALSVIGYADEALAGQPIFSSIHADDVQQVQAMVKQVADNPGKARNLLFRYHCKSGEHRWMEGVVTKLDDLQPAESILLNFRDVTERIIAAEQLKNSEERFRHSMDNMLEGVQIIGFDWRYLYVNDAVSRQGKFSREELLGHTMMERYPGIEQTALFAACKRCFEEREPIHIENEFTFPDQTEGWFELSLQPVPEGIFILSVDISDRKKAAAQLNANEVRFRSLIENISDGIVINDANANILYQSPSVTRILGYTLAERTGRSVLSYVHPDNKDEMLELYRRLERTPGVPFSFEYRFLHKCGHYIWLEGVTTNLTNNPAVNAYVANYRDITERKAAEERVRQSERIYKTIASNIPGSSIALLNLELRFILLEGDLAERLGYSKAKMLGNLVSEVMDVNMYALVKPYYDAAIEGEYSTLERCILGVDTITRFIPIKDADNLVQNIMVVTLDVTELKKAQRSIAELNQGLEEKIALRTEQLKAVNDELESFSYSVSHDLRAPLRAIIGFAAILEEDYSNRLDDEAKRLTAIIRANTLKMGTLIDDLLTFFRLRRHEMVTTTIDCNQVVHDIIASLDKMNGQGSKPEWIVHPLPLVMADLTALRQVWMNLLGNAAKYSSRKQHPIIEIGTKESNHAFVFYVKDNGAGFDARYSGKLFKVFQRLHSEQEFEGTGIGLAIVEKIVSKHGGKVWAESMPEQGATFYFSLPKAETFLPTLPNS